MRHLRSASRVCYCLLQCWHSHSQVVFMQDASGQEPKMYKPGMFAVHAAPFIAASPDYVQTWPELVLVELKCVGQLPPADDIPDHYRYQVCAWQV
jgi:hypothetical protein